MNEEKKTKKPKSKARKIIDWVITGFFGTILLFLLGFNIANKASKSSGMLFGATYPMVLTDSMEPEYMVSDVLIIKKVDPSEIQKGDDVSFMYDIFGTGNEVSVTHRIKDIVINPDKEVGDGRYLFIAHGINKASDQCGGPGLKGDCTYQTQQFDETKLIGRVTGKSPFLRFVYKTTTSIWGLLFFLILPCLYIVVTSIIDILKTLRDGEAEQEAMAAAGISVVPESNDPNDPLAGLSEKEKERLKKELLDELIKGGGKK